MIPGPLAELLARQLQSSTSPVAQAIGDAVARERPATAAELARSALVAAAKTEAGARVAKEGGEALAVGAEIARALFGGGR